MAKYRRQYANSIKNTCTVASNYKVMAQGQGSIAQALAHERRVTMSEELRQLEHDPERERQELIEQAERGRKYRAASEVLNEIIESQRENIIRQLESSDMRQDSDALGLVLYLRVLRICSNLIKARIDEGTLAEEELRDDGRD